MTLQESQFTNFTLDTIPEPHAHAAQHLRKLYATLIDVPHRLAWMHDYASQGPARAQLHRLTYELRMAYAFMYAGHIESMPTIAEAAKSDIQPEIDTYFHIPAKNGLRKIDDPEFDAINAAISAWIHTRPEEDANASKILDTITTHRQHVEEALQTPGLSENTRTAWHIASLFLQQAEKRFPSMIDAYLSSGEREPHPTARAMRWTARAAPSHASLVNTVFDHTRYHTPAVDVLIDSIRDELRDATVDMQRNVAKHQNPIAGSWERYYYWLDMAETLTKQAAKLYKERTHSSIPSSGPSEEEMSAAIYKSFSDEVASKIDAIRSETVYFRSSPVLKSDGYFIRPNIRSTPDDEAGKFLATIDSGHHGLSALRDHIQAAQTEHKDMWDTPAKDVLNIALICQAEATKALLDMRAHFMAPEKIRER